MPSLNTEDIGRLDSPFHRELTSNLDLLIQNLEGLVVSLDAQEDGNAGHGNGQGSAEERQAGGVPCFDAWEKATSRFSVVLGGFQTMLSSLFVEQSRLERDTEGLERQREMLDAEKEELIDKSHNLHCRIQYNSLEAKLDQSFRGTERCSSVDSARCFKEEAEDNLRRTNEMLRVGNLRKCQLDREIFNQMEQLNTEFQKYESEREDYVKEIELFDDVRRKKISNWLNDRPSEEERELGESIIEYLDLSSRRRNMEPKIIGNTLRMHSFNESLAFDRQDNLRRLEEMTSLQKKVDALSGHSHILPRRTQASTNLAGQAEPVHTFTNDDDAYNDFLEGQGHQAPSGVVLHRCPKKVNLVTDPITDPYLLGQLEAALRWDGIDGHTSPTINLDLPPSEGATTTVSGDELQNGDPTSSGQLSTADSSIHEAVSVSVDHDEGVGGEQTTEDERGVDGRRDTKKDDDEAVERHHQHHMTEMITEDMAKCRNGDSVTSVCGDAASQESKCGSRAEAEGGGCGLAPHHVVHNHGGGGMGPPAHTVVAMPRSSHLLLHQIESATGFMGHADSVAQEELMACLVKRKSSGGHSSMTAILSEKDVTATANTPQNTATSHNRDRSTTADDRETRSQGAGSTGGRAGLSAAGNSGGNPRTSRDHV